jgi:Ca-activated chloride channel homolog
MSAVDKSNSEIERMWAWQKIDRLLKEADLSGSRGPAVDEIVRLGEGYSIVTEYTSFIVLENDAEYRRWKIDRRNELRLARDRQQRQAFQAEWTRVREQSLANVGPRFDDANRLATADPPAATKQAISLPSRFTPRDLDLAPAPSGGGRHGGGAFDPVSGTIVLALAGLGFAMQRRRKSADR